MGNQSGVNFALGFVSVLLLLLSVSSVMSQCPAQCECDAKGLKVKCSNQNLVILPKGPFNRKLKTMDLSFNRIGILKTAMFADQEIYSLENLTMSNNTISSLDEPFRGLPALEYLDLSNNDIDTFSPAIFDDIQNLKTLVLHHNPYLELAETGYDLPELIDLILNNCRIKTIPPDFFNKLKTLENVNLSENLIENFDSKLVSGLTNLKHIDLRSNKLYLLHEVIYQLPISIEVLEISYNVWSCNCEMKEAFALYEKGSFEKSALVCSTPEDLKNKSLTEELVALITCTTTEESTTEETTEVVTADPMLQNDHDPNIDVEVQPGNLNVIDTEKSEMKMVESSGQLSPIDTVTMGTEKSDDVMAVVKAGWYTNWMVYGAIGLVLTTSLVVFFVKYQVTKHMRRPGNILERNSADFGLVSNGYQSVSVSDV